MILRQYTRPVSMFSAPAGPGVNNVDNRYALNQDSHLCLHPTMNGARVQENQRLAHQWPGRVYLDEGVSKAQQLTSWMNAQMSLPSIGFACLRAWRKDVTRCTCIGDTGLCGNLDYSGTGFINE